MSLIKIFFSISVIFMTLFVSGCQSNNSDAPPPSNAGSGSHDNNGSNGGSGTDNNSTIVIAAIRLQIQPKSITVGLDSQHKIITILVFKSNGAVVDTGSISVRYPDKITNGVVNGGEFVKNRVEINDGKAVFEFVGPPQLKAIDPLNFNFVYDQDQNYKTTLTVNYVPDIPKIVLDNNHLIIKKNGEVKTIAVKVYGKDNEPYPDGHIQVKYPDALLDGKDVGSFQNSSVEVKNGEASLIYTAPNPIDANTSYLFGVFHDVNPILSNTDLNISFAPDVNQTVLKNYRLHADYETKMDLNISKGMVFSVMDDQNNSLSDGDIVSINATILNPNLGFLEDTDGNKGTSISTTKKNGVHINIHSNTLSGLLPIKVDAAFIDANNKEQKLTRIFNVIVLSGPPTAMSLSYAGTSQDKEHAKFIENWVLTVTDKYNNLVNTNPTVSTGMITGYATRSGDAQPDASQNLKDAKYLFYSAKDGDGNLTDGALDTFKTKYKTFANVDLVNQYLVTYGKRGYYFNTFGKWDISSVEDDQTLALKDDYNGTNVSGLGFAVGNNFRNETCSGESRVANVYPKDNNYVLGDNGNMIIQVEYDYYLVGKTTLLWANLLGSSDKKIKKVGIANVVTLRGDGLTGESYNFAKGFSGIVRLLVHIKDTVEFYKNANFVYKVEVQAEDASWSILDDSMDYGIMDCNNSGVGYVDVNISDGGKGGSVSLTNVLVAPEF